MIQALWNRYDAWTYEPRGRVSIKGKGELETYFLLGRRGIADDPRPEVPLPAAEPHFS